MQVYSDGKPLVDRSLLAQPLPFYKKIDLTSSKFDQNTWYPYRTLVGNNCSSLIHFKVFAQLDTFSVSWGTHTGSSSAELDLMTYQSGWGANNINPHGFLLTNNFDFVADNKNPIAIQSMTNLNGILIYCRGGGIYHVYCDNNIADLSIIDHSISNNDQHFGPTTIAPQTEVDCENFAPRLYYRNLQATVTSIDGQVPDEQGIIRLGLDAIKSDIQNLNQLLAPVLSSNIRQVGNTDLNDLPSGWCVVTDFTSPNFPPNEKTWGLCFTLYVTDADRFQICIAYDAGSCNTYIRTRGGTPPNWIPWKKIAYSA